MSKVSICEKSTMKRSRDEEVEVYDDENKCNASLGACDCEACLEKIVRNVNVLLEHGYVINYLNIDNGAGGYGFDVEAATTLLDRVLNDTEDRTGADWTYLTKKLKSDEIEKIVQEVVPSAWTVQYKNKEIVNDWKEWFHLLK